MPRARQINVNTAGSLSIRKPTFQAPEDIDNKHVECQIESNYNTPCVQSNRFSPLLWRVEHLQQLAASRGMLFCVVHSRRVENLTVSNSTFAESLGQRIEPGKPRKTYSKHLPV